MGRVGSYPTFSPLPRRFSRINVPITASRNGHTVRGISSPHRNLRFDGAPFLGRGGISLLHLSWGHPRRALPVILALWSPDFPHGAPFGIPPRLSNLVAGILYSKEPGLSNPLANSFGKGYTICKNKRSFSSGYSPHPCPPRLRGGGRGTRPGGEYVPFDVKLRAPPVIARSSR